MVVDVHISIYAFSIIRAYLIPSDSSSFDWVFRSTENSFVSPLYGNVNADSTENIGKRPWLRGICDKWENNAYGELSVASLQRRKLFASVLLVGRQINFHALPLSFFINLRRDFEIGLLYCVCTVLMRCCPIGITLFGNRCKYIAREHRFIVCSVRRFPWRVKSNSLVNRDMETSFYLTSCAILLETVRNS